MKARKMRPGGKSADRDALRRNAVLLRVRAHPLHRRRQRGERTGPERRRSTVIPQHKGLDAAFREGAARRSTLADGAVLIAAARAEDQRILVYPDGRKSGHYAVRQRYFVHFYLFQTLYRLRMSMCARMRSLSGLSPQSR